MFIGFWIVKDDADKMIYARVCRTITCVHNDITYVTGFRSGPYRCKRIVTRREAPNMVAAMTFRGENKTREK